MTGTIDVSSHLVMQSLASCYADRGVIIYVLGILVILLAARLRFKKFKDFLHHELPACSWISWTLACFLYATFPAGIFWDLYSVSYQSTIAPYLFNLLTIYMICMLFWGLSCYLLLWRKAYVNTFAVLALLLALGIAIWTTIKFHGVHPVHITLGWLLIVPPILSMITTSICFTFRENWESQVRKQNAGIDKKKASKRGNQEQVQQWEQGEPTGPPPINVSLFESPFLV